MFDFATLTTFIVVVIGLFLVPGPAVLIVLTRTVQGGRKIGLMTSLGVAAGDYIHTLGAAVGLSAVLMSSAIAFNMIKYAGVVYLIYLGLKAFADKPADHGETRKISCINNSKAFFQAVAIEVLNPKTALFFLAFLPQFVSPEKGSVFLQLAILGLIFATMSLVYTCLLVVAVRPLSRIIGRLGWLKRWQGKIIGTILISLGLKLAMQHR